MMVTTSIDFAHLGPEVRTGVVGLLALLTTSSAVAVQIEGAGAAAKTLLVGAESSYRFRCRWIMTAAPAMLPPRNVPGVWARAARTVNALPA
jgi:hypothetical protein